MAIGTQTLVPGQRGTYNTESTTQHIRDVEDKIALLTPIPRPFSSLFFNDPLKNKVSTGIRGKFEWYEDALLPSTATFTEALGTSTTQTVDISANICRIGDIILVEPTDQLLKVTAVGTGTVDVATITGGAMTATGAGASIQIQSPAFAEGSAKAVAITVLAVLKSGYCQIIKHAVTMTGNQQASAVYGTASDWDYQQQKKLLEAELKIENTFLNNGAGYTDGASPATDFTAGMNSLTSNVFSYPDPLSKAFFDASIASALANTTTNVTLMDNYKLYCGSAALMDMNSFMTNIWSIMQNSPSMKLEKFGILSTSHADPKLVTYVHPMGVMLDVYYAPQLKGKYANDIVGVNPDNVQKRFVGPDKKGPRKYRLEMGIETPGTDETDSQILMNQGLQIRLEETHFRIKKL